MGVVELLRFLGIFRLIIQGATIFLPTVLKDQSKVSPRPTPFSQILYPEMRHSLYRRFHATQRCERLESHLLFLSSSEFFSLPPDAKVGGHLLRFSVASPPRILTEGRDHLWMPIFSARSIGVLSTGLPLRNFLRRAAHPCEQPWRSARTFPLEGSPFCDSSTLHLDFSNSAFRKDDLHLDGVGHPTFQREDAK